MNFISVKVCLVFIFFLFFLIEANFTSLFCSVRFSGIQGLHSAAQPPPLQLQSFFITFSIPSQSPGSHQSAFCLSGFAVVDISQKRNHAVCLLCLTSFTQHNGFRVHPSCNMPQYFRTVDGWMIISLFQVGVDMPQFGEPLGCAHFFAVMNNATVNICT